MSEGTFSHVASRKLLTELLRQLTDYILSVSNSKYNYFKILAMFFVHFIHRMLPHAVLTGLANVEIRYFITT